MSGDDVRTLQQELITKNTGVAAQALAKNGATGYFGLLTKSALIEFQKSVGIVPALGYYGSATKAVLAL
jgi:peptidoglycan hydrolase-like protein with peptidoglycan-binding domain